MRARACQSRTSHLEDSTKPKSISLELRKAYDSLERELFLDILSGYGIGPRTILILRTCWGGGVIGPPSRDTVG